MLLDARRVDRHELHFDLCVVGAGAAGITLARELAGSGLRVCVLESGGLELDAKTQALYNGKNVGHPYAVGGTRLRYFGGTTNHWRGWCRPLDEIDFEPRPWIPHSGWPLRRADLDPYYDRARHVCQLARPTYDPADWGRITRTEPFRPTPNVTSTLFQVSPPTRFGKTYRADVERAQDVRVLLHANATRVQLEPNGTRVRSVRVATLSGRRFEVRARRFVLAAGGIENARLMLASNDVDRRGVGNSHDLVGRFFADHPHVDIGSVRLPAERSASAFYTVHERGGRRVAEGMLATTEAFVRAHRLLRSCVALVGPPVGSALGRQVTAVAHDLEGADLSYSRTLNLRAEQAPNPDSRVTLGDSVDGLGMPRVELDWRIGELDRRSAERSLRAIAEALGAAGLGRLDNQALVAEDQVWLAAVGGSHHMGTVRMASDAHNGVVDSDCRVHGVANLYVAGSAVFPTTGYSNPTLTIVALALRLADHLKRSRA